MLGADREDTLTRAEYLAVRGYDTNGSAPENGSTAPTDAATAPNPSAPESGSDLVAMVEPRQCAFCGGPIPEGAHGLARYCSQAHRRAASRARDAAGKDPAAAAVPTLPAVAVGGNGASVAQGLEPTPAPFPAAEIDALLGLGSVGDVTLERAGWRLVVHPRT
jgi:hypothetical protein